MATPTKFKFYSSFIPLLKPGEYSVEATQTITHRKESTIFNGKKLEFHVEGSKFELEAGMVHHVYPAAGIEGDFVADVPSIVFNRVTLPWERKRLGENVKEDDSWLMLFMVDEDEQKELEEGHMKANVLFEAEPIGKRYEDDDVLFLKIPNALTVLFPQENEYQYLSYCRVGEVSDDEGATGQHEKSVIIGNRLPKPGHINTVYLLSLEHCKEESGHKSYPILHKWQFYCFDTVNYLIPNGSTQINGEDFSDSLINTLFNNSTEFEAELDTLKPTPDKKAIEFYNSQYKISGGTFHGLLHRLPGKLSSFTYPISDSNGFVRQGGLVLKEGSVHSGYRGPLQAGPVDSFFSRSKEMKWNLEWTGVKKYFSKGKYQIPVDRSYQVAHELGMLTALKDEAFHKAFYEWKQEVCSALLMEANSQGSTRRKVDHLSPNFKLNATKPLPPVVLDKAEGWKKLQGIPFAYLVPSSKMLPRESIRHFCLDVNWANAFLLGAFSIGNTYDSVEQQLLEIYDQGGVFLKRNRYGFLIQSLAVSGWSDYEVESVLSKPPTQLLIRKKLSKNIEFLLYEGDSDQNGAIQKLTFHLHAGKTHSGFRFEDGKFYKGTSLRVEFYDEKSRVFKVDELVKKLKLKAPAYFGKMMLESTPKVEFNLKMRNN